MEEQSWGWRRVNWVWVMKLRWREGRKLQQDRVERNGTMQGMLSLSSVDPDTAKKSQGKGQERMSKPGLEKKLLVKCFITEIT